MRAPIFSLLILGFVAAALADEKPDVPAIYKVCMAESKATDKEVEEFWMPNVNFDSVSPAMKCHLKCIMEKMGHLKGGVFDGEKATKDWKEMSELKSLKIPDAKAFINCKAEKGENDCETAFKINKCVRQLKA